MLTKNEFNSKIESITIERNNNSEISLASLEYAKILDIINKKDKRLKVISIKNLHKRLDQIRQTKKIIIK